MVMRFKSMPALMLFKPLCESLFFQVASSKASSMVLRKMVLLAWPNNGSIVLVPRLLIV